MVCLRMARSTVRTTCRRYLAALTTICVVAIVVYITELHRNNIFSYAGKEQLVEKTVTDRNSVTDQTKSLIKFMPLPENKNIDNYTFDNVDLYPCSQPNGPGADNIVDLMCIPRPNFLPGFKNPCFRNQDQVLKCLPYFNILGFDKCGTTDFYFRLTSHPAILKCNGHKTKEIYFWTWRRFGIFQKIPEKHTVNFRDGSVAISDKENKTNQPVVGNYIREQIEVLTLEGYMYHFRNGTTAIADKENSPNQPIVGDGGPVDGWDFHGWMLDPQNKGLNEPKVLAPHVMRHILKEPKFFFLMREPAERLYSDYLFLRNGDTPEKFDRDVPVAIEMMNSCLKVNTTRQCFYSDYLSYIMPMRLHISCYSVFLREWLAVFHRKHFLFLRTEDYERNMKETLQAAFSFLGVETLPNSMMDNFLAMGKQNKGKEKKTAGTMFERTKKLLKDFYKHCNADLAALLGDEKYLWLDS